MSRARDIKILLCVLAGVLDFLGFAGFGIFPLAWIAWVPALYAVRNETPKRAFAFGAVFGTVAHLGGYYWVRDLLFSFAGFPIPFALLGVLLLCFFLGLAFAVLLALVRMLERDLGWAPVWTMALAYPAIELVYPSLFPYYIGNSQYRFVALTQIVEVTGLLGLTVILALANGAAFEVVSARAAKRKIVWTRVAVPVVIFLGAVVWGKTRIASLEAEIRSARKLKVALIQTNVGAGEKEAQRGAFAERHQTMSKAAVAAHPEIDLVVWPETAFSATLPRETMLFEMASELNRALLFGAPTVAVRSDGGAGVYNSAILASPTGMMLGRFDKMKLIPFGEAVPFGDTFPVLRQWFPHTGNFVPGEQFQHLPLGDIRLMPMICYEDILPRFTRAMWNRAGPADVLVNLANDSWYGDSHEPWIHLALASFRSIETRRALIRSTNTGVSAVVDPLGRISAHSGQWTRETVLAEVPVIQHGRTTVYMRWGDVIGYVSLVGLLLAMVLVTKRQHERAPTASTTG